MAAREKHSCARPRRALAIAFALASALAAGSVPRGALAQSALDATDGPEALPAVVRLPVAVPMPLRASVAGSAGYAYTEPVLDGADRHHRALGALAVSVRPLHWLGVALRFDGQYDAHTTTQGPDRGAIGEPRLVLRGAGQAYGALGLGLQATLWLPSRGAPSVVPEAASVDLQGVISYAPVHGPVWVTTRLGMRLDNSARSATDAATYSASDRLTLGVSSFSAVLFGAGALVRLGRFDVGAEWAWDLLFGMGSPAPLQSPMYVRAGARVTPSLAHAVTLGALVEASPSQRPSLDPAAPLVPFPPRVAALLTLAVRFPLARVYDPAPPRGGPERSTAPDGGVAAAPRGRVRGRVRTPAGGAVPNAEVRLEGPGGERRTRTDANGEYSFEALAAGSYELTVRASNGAERHATVSVQEGESAAPTERAFLIDAAVEGAQLRGTARAYDGRGVSVLVQIAELNLRRIASDDGSFQFEVPPGQYTVEFSAPGYESQRRRARVDRNGVTILNVDLRRRR